MRIRIALFCCVLIIFPKSIYSQNNDFGVWYTLNGEYAVSKKLDLTASGMIRTFRNGSKIEQAYVELGASYRLSKYFAVGSSYRFVDFLESDDRYHFRNKLLIDLKGSYPAGHFSFSSRLRLEIQKKTYYAEGADRSLDYMGRFRLKGMYKFPEFPVSPYLAIETFSTMFKSTDVLVDKSRATLGLEFKLSAHNYFVTEYTLQKAYSKQSYSMSILSLTYTLRF